MNARSLLVAGLAAGAILALASAALAQTRGAAAPAGPALTFGPAIPGLCVFSEGQIFASRRSDSPSRPA